MGERRAIEEKLVLVEWAEGGIFVRTLAAGAGVRFTQVYYWRNAVKAGGVGVDQLGTVTPPGMVASSCRDEEITGIGGVAICAGQDPAAIAILCSGSEFRLRGIAFFAEALSSDPVRRLKTSTHRCPGITAGYGGSSWLPLRRIAG